MAQKSWHMTATVDTDIDTEILDNVRDYDNGVEVKACDYFSWVRWERVWEASPWCQTISGSSLGHDLGQVGTPICWGSGELQLLGCHLCWSTQHQQ